MGNTCLNLSSTKGKYLVLFLALLSFCVSCETKQRSEDVLAYINDLEINEAHLESAFKNIYYRSGRSISANYVTKKAILETEFRTYVLATYAMDLGFEDDETSLRQKELIYRKVLSEEFLQQNVLDKIVITESDLREIFMRFNTILRASHLFASDKRTADSLYQLLESGYSFDDLASEVFQNPYLQENGGDLGEFQTDEMDIAFENAAHRLKVGEYSRPVKTSQGYSIVKLTDRYVKPLITEFEYANQKANLGRFVRRRKNEMATRSHIKAITENFNMNQNQIDRLWDWVDNNREIFESDDIEILNARNDNSIVVELGDFEFSSKDFFTESYYTPSVNKSRIRSRSQFTDYVKALAYRTYAVNQAKKMSIDEQEMVQGSIDHTYFVYLQNRAVDYLKNQISVTSTEIHDEYFKSPDQFVTPIQIDLSRIVTETQNEATKAYKELTSGVPFELVFEKYSKKIEDRPTGGRLGYVPLPNLGTLGPSLNALSIGEISHPIQYESNEYHIYICNSRVESRPLEIGEAAEEIEPILIKKKLDKLIKQTVEQVKTKHGAEVNDQAIKEFTLNL